MHIIRMMNALLVAAIIKETMEFQDMLARGKKVVDALTKYNEALKKREGEAKKITTEP